MIDQKNGSAAALAAAVLAGSLGLAPAAVAEVSGSQWQTTGSLAVAARFRGQTVSLAQRDVGPWRFGFAMDGTVAVSGPSLALQGTWTQNRRRVRIELSQASVSSILQGIRNDLAAQSGLRVDLEPKSASFTGTEKAGGMGLAGTLMIQARLRYPDYSDKSGALTLRYRYTGTLPM